MKADSDQRPAVYFPGAHEVEGCYICHGSAFCITLEARINNLYLCIK